MGKLELIFPHYCLFILLSDKSSVRGNVFVHSLYGSLLGLLSNNYWRLYKDAGE